MSEELNDDARAFNLLQNVLKSAVNAQPNPNLPPQAKAMAAATNTTPAMFLHAIASGPKEFRDILMNIDPITLLTAVIMMNSMVYSMDEEQAKSLHQHVSQTHENIPSYYSIIGSVIGALSLTKNKNTDESQDLTVLHNLYLAGSAYLQAKNNDQTQTDARREKGN